MTDISIHPRLSERVAKECKIPWDSALSKAPEWFARFEVFARAFLCYGPAYHLADWIFPADKLKDGKVMDEAVVLRRREIRERQDHLRKQLESLHSEPLEDGIPWFTKPEKKTNV